MVHAVVVMIINIVVITTYNYAYVLFYLGNEVILDLSVILELLTWFV